MTQRALLDCTDALDQLEPFLDGELSAVTVRRLEQHLEACDRCASELAWARRVRLELRALGPVECPPSVVESVLEATAADTPDELSSERAPVIQLSSARAGRDPTQRKRGWLLALAATILALIGSAVVLDRFERAPQPEFDAAQLAQAEEEARLALAYLGAVTRRAGLSLRDDVIRPKVIEPPRQALMRLRGEETP